MRIDIDDEAEEDLHVITPKPLKELNSDPRLDFLKQCSPHFPSFAKAFVIKEKLANNTPTAQAIELARGVAAEKGLPKLQEEATQLFPTRNTHNGYIGSPDGMVSFPISKSMGDPWETTASFGEFLWAVKDYGDQLSWEFAKGDLKGELDSVSMEKNQCMILHLAAGVELLEGNLDFQTISKRGGLLRSEIYEQAKLRYDTIGDLSGDVPLIRAELKAHAHDACKRNHDKDNRLLLCFPLFLLETPTCA